jgi:hypothetical protein
MPSKCYVVRVKGDRSNNAVSAHGNKKGAYDKAISYLDTEPDIQYPKAVKELNKNKFVYIGVENGVAKAKIEEVPFNPKEP